MQQIGILGGGQLGMLLARSIRALGAEAIIYEPDGRAPACQEARHTFNGSFKDEASLARFFDKCDSVTYEFENVASELLFEFEKEKPLYPSASVLKTTQDRYLEKSFLKEAGLPHAAFELVTAPEKLLASVEEFGYPCVLKTTRGGYDGKGQWFLRNADDVREHLEAVANRKDATQKEYRVVLEEALDIAMEASCIAARSADGSEIAFPIFENMHKDHILDFTIVPARLPDTVAEKIKEVGMKAAKELSVIGLLTTEFFLTRTRPRKSNSIEVDNWHLLINEFAPRPHNSGHVTTKACTLSQYDALAKILMKQPLEEPVASSAGYYCMGNILGDVYLSQNEKHADAGDDRLHTLDTSCREAHPAVVDVILYGKKEARTGRKMGHFITHADTAEQALEAAKAFRKALSNS
ncbi:MAG TPA: ATP-grasp domain-containing protein [Chroococcales cyanobacterium]